MYCRKCGQQIPNNSKFCPECGNQINWNSANVHDVKKRHRVRDKSIMQSRDASPLTIFFIKGLIGATTLFILSTLILNIFIAQIRKSNQENENNNNSSSQILSSIKNDNEQYVRVNASASNNTNNELLDNEKNTMNPESIIVEKEEPSVWEVCEPDKDLISYTRILPNPDTIDNSKYFSMHCTVAGSYYSKSEQNTTRESVDITIIGMYDSSYVDIFYTPTKIIDSPSKVTVDFDGYSRIGRNEYVRNKTICDGLSQTTIEEIMDGKSLNCTAEIYGNIGVFHDTLRFTIPAKDFKDAYYSAVNLDSDINTVSSLNSPDNEGTLSSAGLPTDLPYDFMFYNGTRWYTTIHLREDGVFRGFSCVPVSASEEPPYETIYLSDFTGQFSNITKGENGDFHMTLTSLTVDETSSDEWIENDVRYIKDTNPNGMELNKEYIMYSPNSIVNNTSDHFQALWTDFITQDYYGYYGCNTESLGEYVMYCDDSEVDIYFCAGIDRTEYDHSIYPDTYTHNITDSDIALIKERTDGSINGMNAYQMLINEIYARHGFKFGNQRITDYFMDYYWYWDLAYDNKLIDDMTAVEARLSQLEKDNIIKLSTARDTGK